MARVQRIVPRHWAWFWDLQRQLLMAIVALDCHSGYINVMLTNEGGEDREWAAKEVAQWIEQKLG